MDFKLILLSPGLYFLLALSFGHWFWKKMTRNKRIIFASSYFLVWYASTTPFLYNIIVSNWERQYPVLNVDDWNTNSHVKIVMLGSGYGHDNNLPPTSLLGESGKARLLESLRLLNHFPNAILVTSGNSATGKIPGAEIAKNAAIVLGIDSSRIKTQVEPKNTLEEAKYFRNSYYKLSDSIILVTSAQHMPRAMQHFKNHGVDNVFASPSDFDTFENNTYTFNNFIPSFRYWSKIQRFNKEILGYYLNL